MTTTATARTRNRPTWKMTSEELARIWAAQHGVTARVGGWLYDAQDRPICQGWASLATYLAGTEVTIVGVGVDWRRSDGVGAKALIAGTRAQASYGRTRARNRFAR